MRPFFTAVAILFLILFLPVTLFLARVNSYLLQPDPLLRAAQQSGLFENVVPDLVATNLKQEQLAAAGLELLTVEQVQILLEATFPPDWLQLTTAQLLAEGYRLTEPGTQLADLGLVIPLTEVKERFTAALRSQLAKESPLAEDLPPCDLAQLQGLVNTLDAGSTELSVVGVIEAMGCWPVEAFGAQGSILFLPGGLPVSPKLLTDQFPEQINLVRFFVPPELPTAMNNDPFGLAQHDRPLTADERSRLAPTQAAISGAQEAITALRTTFWILAVFCLLLVVLIVVLHHQSLSSLLLWLGLMALLTGLGVLLLGLLPPAFGMPLVSRGLASAAIPPAAVTLLDPVLAVYLKEFFRWFTMWGTLSSVIGLGLILGSRLPQVRELKSRS